MGVLLGSTRCWVGWRGLAPATACPAATWASSSSSCWLRLSTAASSSCSVSEFAEELGPLELASEEELLSDLLLLVLLVLNSLLTFRSLTCAARRFLCLYAQAVERGRAKIP